MEIEENYVDLEDEFEGQKKSYRISHVGELLPIQEINADSFDHQDFKCNFLQKNTPLVIRNALGVLNFGTAYRDWSLDYLDEKCGANKVYVRRNTMSDDYKTGKAYQVQEIEFKSYIKDLKENNLVSQNSYLAVQNLRKAFPQIAEELKLPTVEKLHAGPFLWIAREGHYEYTHMDPDDNFLMVIKGRKLVRLYGSDVDLMMPNRLGSKGRTIQSQIDCDVFQNNTTNDKFRQVPCQYCLLKEGDLLYFPSFYWHQVKSPVLTISINVFFGDEGENNFIGKILNSKQRSAFFYWIFNIVQQNMSYPSFNRILANLKESLKNFLFKQWHETLNDSQAEEIYQKIIEYFNFNERIEELKASGIENKSKYPPQLRIRGLLMRDKDDEE